MRDVVAGIDSQGALAGELIGAANQAVNEDVKIHNSYWNIDNNGSLDSVCTRNGANKSQSIQGLETGEMQGGYTATNMGDLSFQDT